MTTVLNFQPLADGKAAITGDFVLVDKEVNAVARVLRQQGIDVTALHNHGLMDTPRLFYMHFWATDDAVKLARHACVLTRHLLARARLPLGARSQIFLALDSEEGRPWRA